MYAKIHVFRHSCCLIHFKASQQKIASRPVRQFLGLPQEIRQQWEICENHVETQISCNVLFSQKYKL